MQLTNRTIERIRKKYRDVFEILEEYDKTRAWPIGRARIDITLDKRIIKKLREESAKTGKPVSRIIEKALTGSMNGKN